MSDFGDLQKFNPNLGIQRERLDELNDYKFGVYKKGEDIVSLLYRDWDFIFQFFPDSLKTDLSNKRNIEEQTLDELVTYALSKIQDLAGELPSVRTIDMKKTDGDNYEVNFTQIDFYRLLFAKLKDFQKAHKFYY